MLLESHLRLRNCSSLASTMTNIRTLFNDDTIQSALSTLSLDQLAKLALWPVHSDLLTSLWSITTSFARIKRWWRRENNVPSGAQTAW